MAILWLKMVAKFNPQCFGQFTDPIAHTGDSSDAMDTSTSLRKTILYLETRQTDKMKVSIATTKRANCVNSPVKWLLASIYSL